MDEGAIKKLMEWRREELWVWIHIWNFRGSSFLLNTLYIGHHSYNKKESISHKQGQDTTIKLNYFPMQRILTSQSLLKF